MKLIITHEEIIRNDPEGSIELSWDAWFSQTPADHKLTIGDELDVKKDITPFGGPKTKVSAFVEPYPVETDQETFDCLASLLLLSMKHSDDSPVNLGQAFLEIVRQVYETGFLNGLKNSKDYTTRGLGYPEGGDYGVLYPIEPKK